MAYFTSGLFCSGASVATRSLVFGRSLGSYCKHREARSKTTVASSVEKLPSKCESMRRRMFLPRIISRACIQKNRNIITHLSPLISTSNNSQKKKKIHEQSARNLSQTRQTTIYSYHHKTWNRMMAPNPTHPLKKKIILAFESN